MIHGAVLLYVNHSVIHTLNISIKKSLFIQDYDIKLMIIYWNVCERVIFYKFNIKRKNTGYFSINKLNSN